MCMIKIMSGDILQSDADAIVIPVNCFGAMGAGLAKQFKDHYIDEYLSYRTACNNKRIAPGKVFVIPTDKQSFVMFPTKYHWKENSRLIDIGAGLHDLNIQIHSELVLLPTCTIAFPLLGCGLGGLERKPVLQMLREYLTASKHKLGMIYVPDKQHKP